jgi:Tfp pilus assembly PilM family ATPase
MIRRTAPRVTPIGLDLGARSIAAVQLRRGSGGGGGRWRLMAATRISRREPGSTVSAAEVERLAGVLDRQGFVDARIVLAVPPALVLSSFVDTPHAAGAAREQIARMELARAQRVDPGSLEAVAWELPAPARATDTTAMMAMGCSRSAADDLLDRFEEAGLSVEALDVACAAMARACAPLSSAAAGTVTLLHLDWSAATVIMVVRDCVAYVRALPECGMAAMLDDLAATLDLPPDVITMGVERCGVASPARGGPGWHAEARGVLLGHVDGLVREVLASCAYVVTRFADASPALLLLLGEGASIAGLADYVATTAGLDVRTASPAELVDCPPGLEKVAGDPGLMVALGLAQNQGQDA